MRQVSMTTRNELIRAISARYRQSDRPDKGRILDEFMAVTGYSRKHAMRALRQGLPDKTGAARPGRRIYDDAVHEALAVIWEASDRICGKRLKGLVPVLVGAMERHGHLQLTSEVRTRLLGMSAATIDRALQPIKQQATGGRQRRRSVPTLAVRRSVPVRTFADWHDPSPGFMEADLVAHGGSSASGSFIQTLVLTDIASGWTECAPLLYREQQLLTEVLSEIRKLLPFALLGFDTDNDSVFMNETVRDYCLDQAIVFTRSRPYRKNDQAFVEQKNGAIVRHAVGYRRFEGIPAAAALARLYASLRLFVNFFQPSFKLAEKERQGALVRKRYHPPATPYQRLLDDSRVPAEVKAHLRDVFLSLDPVQLLQQIRTGQARLVELADVPVTPVAPSDPATLDQFLQGLRTAWKEGEVRPTARPKPPVPRGRRRPDPLVAVTAHLQDWFKAEPWRTGRELLEKLQETYPDQYSERHLRTLQRRLKIWRRDAAWAMVFGSSDQGSVPAEP
ncbi:DDE-type integrase/transposase/recombinase, partial [Microvirga tunisiensis]